MSKPVYATLTLRLRGDEPNEDPDDWINEAFDAAEETLKRAVAANLGDFEVEADAA